jgi:hypothetical protein
MLVYIEQENCDKSLFSYPPQRFASVNKHVILSRNFVRMPVWTVCTEALFYARFKLFHFNVPCQFNLRTVIFGLTMFGWYVCIRVFFGRILVFELSPFFFKFTSALSGRQPRRKRRPWFNILIFQNLFLWYHILLLNLPYLFAAR